MERLKRQTNRLQEIKISTNNRYTEMKRTIFPYDFSPYYPIGIQPCPMYVDVANRIYDRMKNMDINLPNDDKLKKEIAINVAIYYEDKMSGIGLWNAFVGKHLLKYAHSLPFFDDFDVLDKNDVNIKEMELLVWFVLTRNFDDRFLNPLAMQEDASNIIMEVLTEDDEVEENRALHNFIYNPDTANDYFKLKHVLIWLRRSYLLCSPLSEDRFERYVDSYLEHFNKSEATYYAETSFSMNCEIGPMAEKAHLWLADMYLGNDMHEESEKLRSLKYCQQNLFEVIDADSEYAVVKNSNDEEFKMKNAYPDIIFKGSYFCTALVKFADNDWEINGVVFNANKAIYDKMHDQQAALKKSYEYAYPLYMKRTNGKRLAFFEDTKQLKKWLKEITPEMDMDHLGYQLPIGQQVVFLSEKAGIIFAPDIIHAIKCSYNPYYKKCDAYTLQQETMDALINTKIMHPELLHYLLENNMLQDGDINGNYPSELGKHIFTRNIDFIARNHRRHLYWDHDF